MRHAHPMEEMVESAIAVLADDLPDAHDVEQVELALEQVGDALRAGIPLPSGLARWTRALSVEVLGAVASRWVTRLSSVCLPGSADEHEALSEVVSLRDRSESVALGIRRACVGADRASTDLLEPLVAAQGALVDALAFPRGTVEGALGIRRALLGSSGWTDALADVADAAPGAPLALEGAVPGGVAPSDEAITGFISRGAHAGVVLAFAARSPELAESMRETIAVFRSIGEPVGLAARRWLAGAGVVRIGLDERMAAADEAIPEREVDLGVLAPTDAEAWLRMKDGRATLRVLAEPGSISCVSLGGDSAERESEPGVWTVSCESSSEPLRLEVRSADGRVFEVMLELASESDAP